MPKTAPIPHCSEADRQVLEDWARSRTMEARLVERARIVLGCLEGKPVSTIALSLKVRPNTVIDWRRRFETQGIAGLRDRPRSGKPPRYNLFAALEVATGAVHTQTTAQKRRIEFLEFMDRVMGDLPPDKEIHVILDNYCIHKKNDPWLAAHPNVFFHFTPPPVSWLNQVEIWFGILGRKALRGASFHNVEQLRQAMIAIRPKSSAGSGPRRALMNGC